MSRIAPLLLPLLLAPLAAPQDPKPSAKKDVPKVLYAVPLVAKPGEKQKLALRGKNLAAVKEVRVTGADGAAAKVLGAKAVAVPGNYPADKVGDSEVEVELDLPKGAKPGAVKLTAVAAGGESEGYALPVRDDTPAVAEKEPNNTFDQAQAIDLPCAVEGTIRGERDTDVYRFAGKKGEKVRVEVVAARSGSPADAVVALHGPTRGVVASSDDAGGSADPAFAVTLPADGEYHLTVIDAHDLGGPNFGYRLSVWRE
ncbi:MAG TPA: PPC domain-containing protein [Gemmata sp.]|nr:PPC domain-containing protein [Gemmata sp.]